jgi:HD-like signal output (HDOD) protein
LKRVLFVDDEVPVLDGLRARLHALRNRWEMVFVESGPRAITEIEHRPFDVIVTDMRMPGMDGAQLLDCVSERWPETIRIVLSGYAEDEQAARLLPVAHQYLSKPCEVRQLENVIARCLQLHELLREPRLRTAVGRMKQVPAMPRTYAKLRALLSSGEASVSSVSKIISADPAIAAKVLQVVNSAFFRRARAVTNIEQAVSHLGFVTIRNVAMSVEVFSQLPRTDLPARFDAEQLQQDAQKVAAIAHALTAGTARADDAMLAGLLHTIGYWVLVQQCREELRRSLEYAMQHGVSLAEGEVAIIGASHAEIGAYLLGLWGLPHSVIEAVAFQHCPEKIPQTEFDVLAALVTAEKLGLADKPNAFGLIRRANPAIGPEYLRSLHAPFDWSEAEQRAANALREL